MSSRSEMKYILFPSADHMGMISWRIRLLFSVIGVCRNHKSECRPYLPDIFSRYGILWIHIVSQFFPIRGINAKPPFLRGISTASPPSAGTVINCPVKSLKVNCRVRNRICLLSGVQPMTMLLGPIRLLNHPGSGLRYRSDAGEYHLPKGSQILLYFRRIARWMQCIFHPVKYVETFRIRYPKLICGLFLLDRFRV